MADKDTRLKARLPRGFADRTAADIRATEKMVATIRSVYERYGFEPVETPLVEFTETLGKFLPDQDRPNEGVFSFRDEGDDETSDWLSLRYDLTAPLARYVAENWERLPKPYRSYRQGWVFRNEKPGPGRFRQFMQFDADTVGAASPAADAEMCMMMADTLEALGIPRGQYVIKVNSRKVLDGVMEAIGLAGDENAGRRLTVLRALDKLDRLGIDGVRQLLGAGRKDESGDFTKGAGLGDSDVARMVEFISAGVGSPNELVKRIEAALRATSAGPAEVRRLLMPKTQTNPGLDDKQIGNLFRALRMFPGFAQPGTTPRRASWADDLVLKVKFSEDRYDLWIDNYLTIDKLRAEIGESETLQSGLNELQSIVRQVESAGYGTARVLIDFSVVRGLEYYTGAVFEAELLAEIPNDKGQPVVFGSVGGGGRYDGLVGRFMSENVPATGFSIGVSRLQAALSALGKLGDADAAGPVVVLVMDKERTGDYQKMVADLRNAGVAAELYLGAAGMKAQMKYADRRNAPLAIIQGGDEKAKGVVQIKDLVAGKAAAAGLADHDAYRDARPGQQEVAEADLVAAVKRLLGKSS